MKSHTDIPQSQRLAEFLPLESADMYYHNRVDIPDNFPLPIEWKHNNPLLSQEIPCWSLSALLDVFPSVIKRNGKRMFLTLEKAGAYNLYYKSSDRLDELWETNVEPVDTCVDMIVKLKEMNLL